MRDCVFCKIARHEAPAKYIAEWPHAVAFTPIDPVTPGHILVIPTKHVSDFAEDPETTAAVMRDAAGLAKTLGGDCNLITSKGRSATQSVFHLHVHLIPRKTGDQLMVPWGTTGDPHEPHWCKVAQRLQDQLAGGEGHA